MTPDPGRECGRGVQGAFSSAYWCLVPHVVSGLATNIPYLNESGYEPHHPYGV